MYFNHDPAVDSMVDNIWQAASGMTSGSTTPGAPLGACFGTRQEDNTADHYNARGLDALCGSEPRHNDRRLKQR
jgi:hypothetical protein